MLKEIYGSQYKMRDASSYIDDGQRMDKRYSIVKDSSADLGVNSKIVQIRPDSQGCRHQNFKKNFFAYLPIFWYFWEKIKRLHFLYFEYLS